MSQRTLFGGLAKQETYYNHPPTTLFERFVEAFYSLNRQNFGRKEDIWKNATKLWKENKGNEQFVNEYLEKQKKNEKKRKESVRSTDGFFKQTVKKKTSAPYVASPAPQTSKSTDSSSKPKPPAVLVPDSPKFNVISQFLNYIKPDLSNVISSFDENELLITVIHDAAKSFNGISKQLDTVKTSTVRKSKQKISQLQLDIQDLDQSLIDLGEILIDFSMIEIEPSLGFGILEKQVEKKREAVNVCLQRALSIEKLIRERKLTYSLNRRAKQIQEREAKILDDDTIDLKIFAKAGIEKTWDEGLHHLSNQLVDKRPDLGLSYSELLRLAYLLQSSAIVPTEMVFEMFPSLNSRFKKQNILNYYLHSLPLYVLVIKSKEYLINFFQTNCGTIVDKIISSQKDAAPENDEQKETTMPAEKSTVHKKKGQPSIVSKFPIIPEEITNFIKTNGFKAQEKRRDDDFRSCGVSLNDIREHLLKVVPGLAEHGIAANTIRYLFVPVHKSRSSAKRYLSIIPCKVPKKDNSGRTENENNHFIHSRVGLRLEHAATYNTDYTVVSADAMNKIHVGTLAVSRYEMSKALLYKFRESKMTC